MQNQSQITHMSGESPQSLLCGPTVYTVAKWLTYVFSNMVCILIEVNVGCLVTKTVECGG